MEDRIERASEKPEGCGRYLAEFDLLKPCGGGEVICPNCARDLRAELEATTLRNHDLAVQLDDVSMRHSKLLDALERDYLAAYGEAARSEGE